MSFLLWKCTRNRIKQCNGNGCVLVHKHADASVLLIDDAIKHIAGHLAIAAGKGAVLPQVYDRLVDMAGILLASVPDPAKIPEKLTAKLVAIVSLPFLMQRECNTDGAAFIAQPMMVLKQSVNMTELRGTWPTVSNMLADATLCKCLEAVSMLSTGVANVQWCAVVVRYSLGHKRPAVQAGAVAAVPFIAAACNARGVQSGELATFWSKLAPLASKGRGVDDAVARSIGTIVCTAAGNVKCEHVQVQAASLLTVATGTSGGGGGGTLPHGRLPPLLAMLQAAGVETLRYPTISCITCCTLHKCGGPPPLHSAGQGTKPPAPPKEVDATKILPFLSLFEATDAKTRVAMVTNLKHILTHVNVEDGGVAASSSQSVAARTSSSLPFEKCVGAIMDADFNVRDAFVCAIRYFYLADIDVARFKALIDPVLQTGNEGVFETTLRVIGQVGRYAHGKMLKDMVLCLVSTLATDNRLHRSTAFEELRCIALDRHTRVDTLFKDFELELSIFMVKRLCAEEPIPDHLISALLENSDCVKFYTDTLKHTLPYLIAQTKERELKVLADILDVPLNKLVASEECLLATFASLYMAGNADIDMVITWWSKLLNSTSDETLRGFWDKPQVLVSELVLRLGDGTSSLISIPDTGGVHLGFVTKLEERPFKALSMRSTASDDLQVFLKPYLMFTLHKLNEEILKPKRSTREQTRGLRGLTGLIGLMGPPNLASVRAKVMAILSESCRFRRLHSLICDGWSNFVQVMDISVLKFILAEIVVAILPLRATQPTRVAKVLEHLLVLPKNRVILEPHFDDLYFLPEVDELAEVNKVLAAARMQDPKHNTIESRLAAHLMKGILHDSTQLHQLALKRLKKLLSANRDSISEQILSQDSIDLPPLVQEVLQGLMSCVTHENPITRRLAGECLGELGAIDPGRVGLLLTSTSSVERQLSQSADLTATNAELGKLLIGKFLIRAYKSAPNNMAQDRAALAIQNCLKAYGCERGFPLDGDIQVRKREGTTTGQDVWMGLTQSDRDIIHPFLSSTYKTANHVPSKVVEQPIYSNLRFAKFKFDRLAAFKQWMSSWMMLLVNYMKTSPKVPHARVMADGVRRDAVGIFEACLIVAKDNLETTLFIMPHVVLHVIWLIDEGINAQVTGEMVAVLGDTTSTDCLDPASPRLMANQAVFSVIDHMTHWVRRAEKEKNASKSGKGGGKRRQDPAQGDRLRTVNKFLRSLPHNVIALASYRCQDYARALLHLELCPRLDTEMTDSERNGRLDAEELNRYLQSTYHHLEDVDSVAGVSSIREGATPLDAEILEHRAAGRWTHALSCYERKVQSGLAHVEVEVGDHQGLLECQMMLGHLKTAVTHATGTISDHPEWAAELNSKRVEAAWRLSAWDQLAEYLQAPSTPSFEMSLGKIVLAARNRDVLTFTQQIEASRDLIGTQLAALGMEHASYERAYSRLLRLHMLTELEQSMLPMLPLEIIGGSEGGGGGGGGGSSDGGGAASVGSGSSSVESMLPALRMARKDWDTRLSLIQSSYRNSEPILALRRCILALSDELCAVAAVAAPRMCEAEERGTLLVRSAVLARQEGLLQTAYMYTLHAKDFNPPGLAIEHARLLWDMQERRQALIGLEAEVKDVPTAAQRQNHAEALLQVADWTADSAAASSEAVINLYKKICVDHAEWEEGYYAIAKYYEQMYEVEQKESMQQQPQMRKANTFGDQLRQHIVRNYGLALEHGSKYIYQALPRLLTLWLDYGAQIENVISDSKKGSGGSSSKSSRSGGSGSSSSSVNKASLDKLNQTMENIVHKLPAFQFLTALPQLTSRMCHRNDAIFGLIQDIFIKLLKTHHQQTLWNMMAAHTSTDSMRSRRCSMILKKAESSIKSFPVSKVVRLFIELTEQLLNVCNKKVKQEITQISMRNDFTSLHRMTLSNIVIPLTPALTATLPRTSAKQKGHNPFPTDLPCIAGFEDRVVLLPSLQRPRKITIRGTDGKLYIFLCKPKDDLRRDCRVMEFNALVNKLLKKDPESRRRQLKIRCYAVMPLNEECGLLEWVPNTNGYRNIVNDLYRSKNNLTRGSEIKSIISPRGPNKGLTQQEIFVRKLLPKFPPVFAEWFVNNFPDPTMWYSSRTRFVRTAAVMSMVGFVIGLGDRHGENILFDGITGDTVHVDFNCLFNRGELFATPEKVPFRLTQNMVHALGPMGVEGVFRRSCEVTLEVMRKERDPLLSVLRTFVYDPLVEWSNASTAKKGKTTENVNAEALKVMGNIDRRLCGKTKHKGVPLSVEGHVQKLIQDATSNKNLSQMYIGWAAYL